MRPARPPRAPQPPPAILPSQFIEEAERSLNDAIMNTRRLLKNPSVIAGGGAIEMELSAVTSASTRAVRTEDAPRTHGAPHTHAAPTRSPTAHPRSSHPTPLTPLSAGIHGKQQLLISAFAKALEVVPRQVAGNAGMDPTDVLNKLRMKHAHGGKWYGVDVIENGICDTMESFVWEATIMKRNALAAATEAACLILSVDETVRNPASEQPDAKNYPGGRGMGGMMGRGRGREARRRPRDPPDEVSGAPAERRRRRASGG